MGLSAAGRAPGHASRLPDRLKLTKVQLPNLHLRDLDKAWRCVTFENGPPSGDRWGTCSSLAPRARWSVLSQSVGIGARQETEARSGYQLSSLAWRFLPPSFTFERETRPVNVAVKEPSCKPPGLNMLQGKVS